MNSSHSKLQSKNVSENISISPIRKIEKKPLNLYPIMGFVVLALVAIEIPYRSIHIPQPIMISFGILSFAAISFMAFENFFLAMLILVSYLPFSSILPGDFGGFLTAFNLTNILTGVIVVGWFAKGSFRGQRLYTRSPIDVILGIFCLAATVSLIRGSIMGSMNENILFGLKRYLTPFFFFYVFANNIRTRKEIEYIYVSISFVTFCAAFMALKESYLDVGSFGSWDSMRIGGICKQPNDLAAYFSYYTPFILVPFLINFKDKRYWILGAAAFFCFWATTRTFSRGGMIAFVATMIITISLSHKKTGILTLIAIIIIVTWFPWILPESIIGRFKGTYKSDPKREINLSHLPGAGGHSAINPDRLDKSASRRLRIWGDALPHIVRNPVFGIGYGNFGRVMVGDAHNGFILICTEMGIPALILYLYILWRLGCAANYVRKFSPFPIIRYCGQAYLCSIIGVFIANQFGSRLNSQELSSLFWIMGGIIIFIEGQMKNRDNEEFITIETESEAPRKISGIIEEKPVERS
ncbi:MAG: O-antigen ligase family protein [Planctomycetota bacterium]